MSSTTSIGSGTTLRPTTPFDASDFYWLHLRGETTSCQATSRFLLLHGWLQDQTAWGQLPRRLLEHYGGEVILLDFFGMGRSPDPPEVRDLTPDLLLQQVECCARKANWLDDDSNRKIVVAGMSLGGGIGLRFASRHVHLIERIVLVAPSALPDTRTLSVVHWAGRGFTERIGLGAPPRLLNPAESIFKPIVSAVGRTAKLLDRGRRRGLLHRIACNANLVQHAPNYGCSWEDPQRLADHGVPLSHISAGLDYVVQPHLSRYICDRVTGVNLLRWPTMTHEWMCTNMDSLKLDKYPQLWTDVKRNPSYVDYLDDHVLMHDGQWIKPRRRGLMQISRL